MLLFVLTYDNNFILAHLRGMMNLNTGVLGCQKILYLTLTLYLLLNWRIYKGNNNGIFIIAIATVMTLWFVFSYMSWNSSSNWRCLCQFPSLNFCFLTSLHKMNTLRYQATSGVATLGGEGCKLRRALRADNSLWSSSTFFCSWVFRTRSSLLRMWIGSCKWRKGNMLLQVAGIYKTLNPININT